MGNQFGGGSDGHELDEAIYLLSGYQVCYHCGSQLIGLSWKDCHPHNWRDEMDPDLHGIHALQFAKSNDRWREVTERAERWRKLESMPERSF